MPEDAQQDTQGVGATIAILTALLQLFKSQEAWLTHKSAQITLETEKRLFKFDSGNYHTFPNEEDKCDKFIQYVTDIIRDVQQQKRIKHMGNSSSTKRQDNKIEKE